jgi:hypothetical protein
VVVKILPPTRVFAKLWVEVISSTTVRYSNVSMADRVLKASQEKLKFRFLIKSKPS